jgi:hypothetical protein
MYSRKEYHITSNVRHVFHIFLGSKIEMCLKIGELFTSGPEKAQHKCIPSESSVHIIPPIITLSEPLTFSSVIT